MDKKLLKEFAMKSRESLTSLVRAELNAMHIAETINWTQSGELYQTIVDGRNIVLTIDEKSRYDKLQAAVKTEGIKAIAEKAAYTWFNRIVAIRYMELNEILPQGKHNEWLGVRVLSDDNNHSDPEILKASNLRRTDLDLQLDVDKVLKLARDEEKFRMVLLAVVKKLGSIMPDVFNGDTNSIDFLLPKNLLGAGGFVSEVLKLPVALFDRVEVIGWLYQYYNQAEKDIAMKKKSAVEKDEIPYVTQIFTPDWIVKYMVENSLGRYWLEHGGDEHLATNWKYLIKSSTPTANVVKKMPNIEDVTFIDPCAGSGHILVYAFEVFYQIYLSLGYAPAQIPEKILTHNLYGLDIDDRAKQLSILSALLVARSYDKDIFTKHVQLNITSVAESNGMSGLPELLKGESRELAAYLVDTFRDAKEYGSILKVKSDTYAKLRNQLDELAPLDRGLYANRAEQLIHQAEILSGTYTIAVTNPPYMNKYDAKLKTYVNTYYPESKADLYSVFIEVCLNLAMDDGYVSMVTMQSWMFLTGQEKLRNMLQSGSSMVNMIHLGPGAFPEMVGDVLQTTAFTLRKGTTNLIGDYIRVTDVRDSDKKEKLSLAAIADETHELRFRASNADFEVFPGKIIAYWASEAVKRAFVTGTPLSIGCKPTQGLATGDNNRFVRFWQEVSSENFYVDSPDASTAALSGKKWFPYNKGGEFRKWYGNNDCVVNWQKNGYEIKHITKNGKIASRAQNTQYYFSPSITWSKISSGSIAFRYKPAGHIFDVAGTSIFTDKADDLQYIQGVLNSNAILKISRYLSPTLNFEVGQIATYPIIRSAQYRDEVIRLVEECRKLSKTDWDSFETSWDFERHPLLPTSGETKLADTYDTWDKSSESRWNDLKANEERLNEIFIEVYGMQGELTKTVEDKYVSVRKADTTREAKSLLSYFVGVMFGRYSLNKPGINFAGGDWASSRTSSLVDEDNIVPIMDSEYYADDIIKQLRDFLTTVYGESTLHSNLDWLANATGRRATENAEDTIRRYFVNDFFADHFREYGKRPIYWLLTSGNDNGFKALFYLHRYQPNLIATVRIQYLLNTQNIYTKRLAELDGKTALNNDELRLKVNLITKLVEIKKYDELIAVAASKNVKLDLDDGVKVNYPKLSQCAADVKPGSEILEMKGVKL
jgi:hypothetical protein